jgi:hypothetical protein
MGVIVSGGGLSRIRKGRIDQGNNGVLVKQIVKKRPWWNATTDENKVN